MSLLGKLWSPSRGWVASDENVVLLSVAEIDDLLRVYGWGDGAESRMQTARRLRFWLWRREADR